jgi:catechol 2,3-dioxygenase-like lactoylglutathione lyase family enzyme
MRLRLELFVDDVQRSIDWYVEVLGFVAIHADPDYASLQRGDAVIGLGQGRSQAGDLLKPGAGVEIVLELDNRAALELAAGRVADTGWPLAEPPTDQPWGLRDFRIVDPDGYYLRITHGNAAAGR